MGKKGLVTSIFSKLVDTSSSPGGGRPVSPPWPWPSCRDMPQTTSFRAGGEDEEPCCTTGPTARRAAGAAAAAMTAGRIQLRGAAAGEMYKTVNSVYFDSAADNEFSSLDGGGRDEEWAEVVDDESCFSTTTASEEWSEAVIRSLSRSTSTHRFFFDPGPPEMNSVLPAALPPTRVTATTTTPASVVPPENHPEAELDDDDGGKEQQQQRQPCTSKSLAEGSVAVAVDSSDPFGDFRASMEEMVAAHGLRDWTGLEELLSWYLRVNAKHNHSLIVGAFVDLLIGLASSTTTAATTTTTTSNSGKSSTTTTTTTTTTSATSTATPATAAAKRCGNEASCSSSSSSCAAPDDSREEKAGGGDPSCSDDDHHHIHHD